MRQLTPSSMLATTFFLASLLLLDVLSGGARFPPLAVAATDAQWTQPRRLSASASNSASPNRRAHTDGGGNGSAKELKAPARREAGEAVVSDRLVGRSWAQGEWPLQSSTASQWQQQLPPTPPAAAETPFRRPLTGNLKRRVDVARGRAGASALRQPRLGRHHRTAAGGGYKDNARRRAAASWPRLVLAPRPPCEWCHGRADGVYADHLAQPALSASFSCRDQQLLAVLPCPVGTAFDERQGACRRSRRPTKLRSASSPAGRHGDGGAHPTHPEAQGSGGEGAPGGGLPHVQPAGRLLKQAAAGAQPGPSWAEVNSLLAFKAQHFDLSGVLRDWVLPRVGNSTAAVRRWAGVACRRDGHVQQLTVDTSGLAAKSLSTASVPPSFSDLQWLEALSLAGSSLVVGLTGLTGPLPSSLGALSRLSSLVLTYNALEGPLPSALAGLTALQEVNLQQNGFTGGIPDWVGGSWRAATSLALNNNLFTGSIPASLGNLRGLVYLSLSANFLSGPIPSELSQLTALTKFDVGGNSLASAPPEWLHVLPPGALVYMDNTTMSSAIPQAWSRVRASDFSCISCGLSGPLPADVLEAMLRNGLTSFDLSYNSLTGSLPVSLAQHPSLKRIHLSNNQLSGNLSRLVQGLTEAAISSSNLAYLILSNNQISGSIPSELFQLTSLIELALDSNSLTGPLPKQLCTPDSFLNTLNVQNNSLSGTLAPSLADSCSYLAFVDISANSLSGPFPAALLNLDSSGDPPTANISFNRFTGPLPVPTPETVSFAADGNDFSGPLPAALSSCTALQHLGLSSNPRLTGEVPPRLLSAVTGLVELNTSRTGLSGPLPGFLKRMPFLRSLDLSFCNLSGPLPTELARLPWLQFLDLSHNRLSGSLFPSLGNLSAAHSLSFAFNEISGEIPPELAPVPQNRHLPLLQSLDLSHNSLSGAIPFQFSLSPPNATLNFASNNLSGPIPEGTSGSLSHLDASLFANNSGLCGGPGYAACPGTGGLSAGAVAGICVGAAAAVLLLALLLWRLLRRPDKWAGGTLLVFEKLDYRLSVQHVLQATERFSDKHLLGRGGFGSVYKAQLPGGLLVAVKRLASGSTQGDKEFQAEMKVLGSVNHRNLVRLVAAFCSADGGSERLLLYRFLPGGSMEDLLAGKKEHKDAAGNSWEVRLQMALDTARGLKYLHHECSPRIVHRDMKPANVLLDEQLQAYVADFGLAKELDRGQTHASTAVFGTVGYMAPEYIQFARCSFKTDVFAFGVMLLQLVTGKRPTDDDVGDRGLSRWVASSSSDFETIVDPRLRVQADQMEQVLGIIKLGLLCTARVAVDRPSIAEVVHVLENLEEFAQGIELKAHGKA